MKILYRIYQVFVALPILLVATLLTSIVVVIGCGIGMGGIFGYYPGKWWARIIIWVLLIPVKVEGRENLVKGQSYVFVSNHQGAFDIFLIYGYLNRHFKWMMKKGIRKIPFVGAACAAAQHIFVDRTSAGKVRATYRKAREILQGGISLVVFPEGARTFTGQMAPFKRGAYMLADELQLPVCPMTINGSFKILPRTKDWHLNDWHPMTLTIHKPIEPIGTGPDNVRHVMEQSEAAILSALDVES